MRKALKRISIKVKNLVDECHKKITAWLFKNFDVIILPKLNTNSFCQQNISKKVKNKIKTWRHCSLLDRIKCKNREYPETVVLSPTEEYTRKTWSHCGWIYFQLGSNKEYVCSQTDCRSVFDRDVNGAFNILLKTLTDVHREHPSEADNLLLEWV